jgi:glycerophosphoryl diester phosphodiesterase
MHKPLGRPQVVAHRGSSAIRAEHTLGAYLRALDDGAEGLECDVRLTADGHLVCVHDRRVDRTTNATGIVSTMRLDELSALDAASWKGALVEKEAEYVDPEHTTVLNLRRLLDAVRDYDRVVDVAIETKHPTRYGGLVEQRLVELLEDFGWAGPGSPVRVMSFSARALTRVQKMAPALEVVLLIEGALSWQTARGLLRPGWIAGPGIEELRTRPHQVARLAAEDRRIHVWTVNSADDLELCLDNGVEAVMTDRPDLLRSLLT